MGVLDWLTDAGLFGNSGDSSEQAGAAAAANMGAAPPMQSPPIAPSSPPTGAPAPSADPQGINQPDPSDLSTQGSPAPQSMGAPPPSVPLPQPRPPGAPGPTPAALNANGAAAAPAPSPSPAPPGPPLNIQPPAQTGPQPAPSGFNPNWFGRMMGVTSADQAAKYGQQMGSGLAEGLKSVGQNWNKPGLAAFAGSMGAGMEGGQKRADIQEKQAADYLNAAIKAKQQGDEAGYKQNYLQYLAAKLKADTDKAASPDAKNKNDTPTQLYLSAQRLVQNDPEVVDARKALESARKTGEPADVTAATNRLQQVIQQKQAQHLQGVGLNPQIAAQIGKQPGNSQENPVNGKTAGLTADNIGKKLQPGQWFTNPADGKLYQYKGTPQKKDEAVSGVPSKPTSPPEPINPMKPYKTPASTDDDEE